MKITSNFAIYKHFTLLIISLSMIACATNAPVSKLSNNKTNIEKIPAEQQQAYGKELFSAIYSIIATESYKTIPIESLYIKGLESLKYIDSNVAFHFNDDSLTIALDDIQKHFAYPKVDDIELWTELTYTTLHSLKRISPKFKETKMFLLEARMIDKTLAFINQESHFSANKKPTDFGVQLMDIGIDVSPFQNQYIITQLHEDLLPANTNLNVGDELVKINQVELTSENIAQGFQTNTSSQLELTINSNKSEKNIALTVNGENQLFSFHLDYLDYGIGYIRISQFFPGINEFFTSQVKEYFDDLENMQGIVVDLRGTHGEELNETIYLVDKFLTKGDIVTFKQQAEGQVFEASEETLLPHIPIVVLIDSGTSHTAELFAAALKENQRALLIGSPTAGNGLIYTVYPSVKNDYTMSIASNELLTPNGNYIQYYGVSPHICTSQIKTYATYRANLKEAINTGSCEPTLHLRLEQDLYDEDVILAIELLSSGGKSI